MKKRLIALLFLFTQTLLFSQVKDTIVLANITITQLDTLVFIKYKVHTELQDIDIVQYLSDFFKDRIKPNGYRKL
jgi:hypothetical protein